MDAIRTAPGIVSEGDEITLSRKPRLVQLRQHCEDQVQEVLVHGK
jgi:hypothetical protein